MGRKKRTDPSERDVKIIEMRNSGKHTIVELSEIFGVSKQRVLQICDKYNCRKFYISRKQYDERNMQIVQMRESGDSTEKIGEIFGISSATVYAICLRYNYAAERMSKDTYEQIIGLYKDGKHTQVELAEKFNISQTHVSRIILEGSLKPLPRQRQQQRDRWRRFRETKENAKRTVGLAK
jgi:transposase